MNVIYAQNQIINIIKMANVYKNVPLDMEKLKILLMINWKIIIAIIVKMKVNITIKINVIMNVQ